jgi:hypothetical protein
LEPEADGQGKIDALDKVLSYRPPHPQSDLAAGRPERPLADGGFDLNRGGHLLLA